MKYKTFITTLALFLFFFFLGIFFISVLTFKDAVHHVEEKSLNEHYFIVSALTRDFNATESRGFAIDVYIESLLQPYSNLFQDEKVHLTLYKGNDLIYSSRWKGNVQKSSAESLQAVSRMVAVEKEGDKTFIEVSGKMPEPYQNYTIVYHYDISDTLIAWEQNKNLLFIIGLILSLLFSLGLLLVLNHLFKPLEQISKVSRSIAAGNYETRLPMAGYDEISDMAKSFNHMAVEIQSQIQQLTTAAEQRQQFIDNLAHELRTPLTSIYGYAEYIQKVAHTEEDRLVATNYIMSESRRMQNIAHRLLDLATIRGLKLKVREVLVDELLSNVEQTMEIHANEKKVKIIYENEIDYLTCDAELIHLLLVNLIENALKACNIGGAIRVIAKEEKGIKVISVQDNGKGMQEDQLHRITEPFYRVEPSRSRTDGGAGLGLTLCKQIAVSHGAELSFSSKVDKGTTARLFMKKG